MQRPAPERRSPAAGEPPGRRGHTLSIDGLGLRQPLAAAGAAWCQGIEEQ